MSRPSLTRRAFAALLTGAPVFSQTASESHLGSLYPPVQAIADASPQELSFLRPEFTDLSKWQHVAREKLFDLLEYTPAKIAPDVQMISRRERDGFVEEVLKKVSWRPAPMFIMDVCDSEDGLRVLELNSFGCSGHYLADLSAVVRAASELASHLW